MNLRNFLKFCIFLIIFIFCNSFYCYSKGNVNLNKDLQYKFYNFKLNKDNMFEFLRNPTVEFLNKNYDRVITYILGDFNTKSIGTGKNITTNIKAILNNGFETKEYYPENTGAPARNSRRSG